MNYKILKNKVLSFFILVTIPSLFGISHVYAADLSIVSPQSTTIGQRFSLGIFINPKGQDINSIASSVTFSKEHVDYVGFNTKESGIPIWVEEPKLKQDGKVYFSGVTPGGFSRGYDSLDPGNESVFVVKLFFVSKKEGSATFSLEDPVVLQNDGKGTGLQVLAGRANINIYKANDSNNEDISRLKDQDPPSIFVISIIKGDKITKTPSLAVFSGHDSNGGIDHYEVSIGSNRFKDAKSPFPLPKRLIDYKIKVQAFDLSGNINEQEVMVPGMIKGVYLICLSLVAIIMLGFFAYRYYNKSKS